MAFDRARFLRRGQRHTLIEASHAAVSQEDKLDVVPCFRGNPKEFVKIQTLKLSIYETGESNLALGLAPR